MLAYIIRRSLQAIPTVLGVLFILFILFFAVADPSDIAAMALGEKAQQEHHAVTKRNDPISYRGGLFAFGFPCFCHFDDPAQPREPTVRSRA